MINDDLNKMTEEQLERVVKYFSIRAYAIELTSPEIEREAHAKRLLAIKEKLEELRAEIRAERISYGEIFELQTLAKYIDPSDVELLQWAGVPEKQ